MEILPIFAVLLLLFGLQSIGGFFQVKDYQRAVHRVNQAGMVGIGQKKGRMLSRGHIAIIACDKDGVITKSEVLDGMTFMARFRPMTKFLGQEIEGRSIYEYLQQIRVMESKKRKQYKGYEQALEALENRLTYKEKEQGGN